MTHHRPAVHNAARLAFEPAGGLDQIAVRRADRDEQVLRLLDGRAVNGDDAVDERHAGIHELGDLGKRRDVDDDNAERCKTLTGVNDLAERVIKDHLLRALRIGARQLNDAHRGVVGKKLLHRGNGVRLVVFNGENKVVGLDVFPEELDTAADILAVVKHHAVVARDVRLALRTVDEHGLDVVAQRRVKLPVNGERRAAETDNAALVQILHERGEILRRARGKRGIDFHFSVVLNADDRQIVAEELRHRIERENGAGNGRMNLTGDAALAAGELLTDADIVADADDRHGGGAHVHVHGEKHFFRRGKGFGLHSGGVLVMGNVNRLKALTECHQNPTFPFISSLL